MRLKMAILNQEKIFAFICCFCLLIFLSYASYAQDSELNKSIEVETEATYQMRPGDSRSEARNLALFEAKRAAIDIAGKYLVKKDLIEFYERRKEEIYNLAADQIEPKIVDQKWTPNSEGDKFFVRITSAVHVSDFIHAEIRNLQLESEEAKASFRQEMEPSIDQTTAPGFDIAKANRLMRKGKWRIAIIYLNRLESKYSNWDAVYLAKSHAYYLLHDLQRMKASLVKACDLGNKEACDDLKKIKRVHDMKWNF